MAIAAEEAGAAGAGAGETVTADHAAEYNRLVAGGSPPGRETLRRARTNVAHVEARRKQAEARQRSSKGQRRSPFLPSPQQLVRRARSQAAQAGQQVSQAKQAVSTPSRTAGTVTRLIWAIALGLIALEVASEATGQYWSFSLPGGIGRSFKKEPYSPLYKGQPQLSPVQQAQALAANQPSNVQKTISDFPAGVF